MTAIAARAASVLALVAATLVAPAISGVAARCEAATQPGMNRAGLVVRFTTGLREFCVEFTDAEVADARRAGKPGFTGMDLLRRSGLAVSTQSFGGSEAVCKIGSEGCDYPREDCFCRKVGSVSVYWGYYTVDRATGAWAFSNVGASTRTIRNGDMDGWSYGTNLQDRDRPPSRTLAQVCENGTVVRAPAGAAASSAPASSSASAASPQASAGAATPSLRASSSPAPVVSPTPRMSGDGGERRSLRASGSPQSPARGAGSGGLAVFGGVSAALGVWAYRARRSRRTP